MLERYFGFLKEDAQHLRATGFGGLRTCVNACARGPANPGAGWNR